MTESSQRVSAIERRTEPSRGYDVPPTNETLEAIAALHRFVLVTELNGRVVWVSEALAGFCGGRDAITGRSAEAMLDTLPSAPDRLRLAEQVAFIHRHMQTNQRLERTRLDLRAPNHGRVTVELSAFKFQPQDRPEPLIIGILQYVDPRQNELLRMQSERDQLQTVIDDHPDAVLTLDRVGFVTFANPAAATLLGHSADHLIGQPVTALLPPSANSTRAIRHLGEAKGLVDFELEIERPDGVSRWLCVNTRARKTPDGRSLGQTLYLRSIQREVEAQRRQDRRVAELENYVQAISHDLRSPLVSLLGFSRLLRDDYAETLDEQGRHFTDRIEQAGRSMERLISDLGELSRIGTCGETPVLLDPRRLLLQLQAEIKLVLDETHTNLVLPENPPLVLCDHTRLYQLLSNLVMNAVQHMGQVQSREIRIEIRDDDQGSELIVSDNGVGIAPEHHERIFELFQCIGSNREVPGSKRRSTGMGLALVKRIAETSGGRVWVESEPGAGSRFHVILERG